ncbi:hypothetical protein ACLOJK_026883 [Asimina triloba]
MGPIVVAVVGYRTMDIMRMLVDMKKRAADRSVGRYRLSCHCRCLDLNLPVPVTRFGSPFMAQVMRRGCLPGFAKNRGSLLLLTTV